MKKTFYFSCFLTLFCWTSFIPCKATPFAQPRREAILSFASVTDTTPFLNGWTKAKILSTSQGLRPRPSEYLPFEYIFNFEYLFQNGASYIAPRSVIEKAGKGGIGRPDGQFVTTSFDMDWILADANGRLKDVEAQLGLAPGTWAGQELVRVDIKEPCSFNLRMPSGNEMGINKFWVPGGRLLNSYFEAVIDPIPTGYYTVTTLKLK